jgi:hypothetical protein
MKRHLAALALAAGIGGVEQAQAQFTGVLFQETFNGVIRGPSVNERLGFALQTRVATDPLSDPRPAAFTHVGPITPTGSWTVDNNFANFNLPGAVDLTNPFAPDGVIVGNTGILNPTPADGVDEWEGWSFADKNFWSQGRSSFTNASGVVAVVDPDEYDDLGAGRAGGYYNSGLTTAPIPLPAAAAGGLITLNFDSSWRAEAFDDRHEQLYQHQLAIEMAALPPGPTPEQIAEAQANAQFASEANNQTAIIFASFNGGTPDFVSFWDSNNGVADPDNPGTFLRQPSITYKGDNMNENIDVPIVAPSGATTMQLTFAMVNAANDWWWAVDNLELSEGGNAAFWDEDFESVALAASVNERISNVPAKVTRASNAVNTAPRPDSFTHTPPDQWSVDNSGMPASGLGDNDLGVFEFEGWTFADRDFWLFAEQGDAAEFTKADGSFAIADSDEYDDLNSGAGSVNTQPYNTVLESPELQIAGVNPGTLFLQFDSAWLPEGNQLALITVDYGNGEIEVLRWESVAASPDFHSDNLNETVLVDLLNPLGASTATVRFKYLNAGNNWFWAIDNVQIGTIPEPASLGIAVVAGLGIVAVRRRRSAY